MNYGFQITMEDVYSVINDRDDINTIALDEVLAERVLTMLDFAKIEDMALCGDDLDEQTKYAYDEIKSQIDEKDLINICSTSDESAGHLNV